MAPLLLLVLFALLTIHASALINIGEALVGGLVKYKECLSSHPLPTNMLTASILSVCSDSASQAIERKGNENKRLRHSYYRSATMAIYGSIISGAFVSAWFEILNGLFPPPMTLSRVIQKVAVNQIFMSPVLNGMFFTWVVLTRDLSSTLQEKASIVRAKLGRDLMPTIKRSCVFWSTLNLLNFFIIPIKYQLLYTNLAFLIWTTYISIVGYRK